MDLFRKNIERRCAYCANGSALNEREVACRFRGVTDAGGACRRFAYDPHKRVPPRPAALDKEKFSKEDFEL